MHAASAGPAHILVVDDEPAITDLLATALRYMGYRVSTAANGRDALDAATSAAPDLVVLDVMLPDIDGFEVCRRLRAARDFVPVIFLSARDSEDDRVTGLRPWRRRLRHEAVLARGAHAADRRPAAARPGRRRRRRPPALPRSRDGRGPAPGLARRRGGGPVPDRVPAAPLLPAQPGAGALEAADPRPRLAVRLQRRGQRRRDLRQLPAAKARRQPSRGCCGRSAGSATCSEPTAGRPGTDR